MGYFSSNFIYTDTQTPTAPAEVAPCSVTPEKSATESEGEWSRICETAGEGTRTKGIAEDVCKKDVENDRMYESFLLYPG